MPALEHLVVHDHDVALRCAAEDAISILSVYLGDTISLDGAISAPSAFLARAMADPDPRVRIEVIEASRHSQDPCWIIR